MRPISRRRALALGVGSAAMATLGWRGKAAATPKDAAEAIAKFTGGKAAEKGNISIEIPEIAENGNTVPIKVSVDAPMQTGNYVSDVLVIADGNPLPRVVTFRFTPMSGKAVASTRIRLATTENIIAVAKTSGGQVFTAQKLVKVTIGGCGG
ncbi:MAG TPA: thiosulfate oxidation carrier protein SoxY [Pseudolabrys sp.]|nr:thiosulfate oxidation carrier protein SoxY [Pseudolabrys sp.]